MLRLRFGYRLLPVFLGPVLLALAGTGEAGDWPGWRGPTGLGYTDEKDLPLTWNGKTGENILWKALLHGGGKNNPEFSSPGWSCPIVWGDRIFLTTSTWPAGVPEKERRKSIAEHHVLCFQASDGKQLWDTVVPAGKILVDNFYHGYTVPTPVTDGKSVFALFGSGVLAALDFEGKIVWQEELPHVKDVDGGVCSSPILYEDSVIIAAITPDVGLRALDKKTGKVKWEQKTKVRTTMATPALVRIGDKLQLIHNAGGIQGLDPATGELIWSCKAQSSQSSVVYGGGLLYVDHGRGGEQGTAVDPTGKGDVTKTNIKWQIRVRTPAGTSGIAVGDSLYRICEPGFIRCWKMETGELQFEERVERITPSASPIATADGRIYFGSSNKTFVIKAGPKYELLATNDLNDGPDYTTPAVSQGRLYIKGKSYLWCIGKK
jgi:outer membrane protein assembly factor BamB